jgi:hypothetical protein
MDSRESSSNAEDSAFKVWDEKKDSSSLGEPLGTYTRSRFELSKQLAERVLYQSLPSRQ